ncbi:phospho-N-acetylmuramoyl-pentapeptide-transferase [Candidatus Acidulodesulfobacterium sp. H_13]|uniref:phospho-N-acetylmuramoyl-pentapeptide- transferase n=1 Tax=Candidatus Acidulodesulfobacterium sp. H_13 TaxID=3395470 RepID=UPI003AF72465
MLNLNLDFLRYITFRASYAIILSLILSIVFGKVFIKILKRMKVGQIVREDGPKSHISKKKDIPTMGGFLILFSAIIPVLLLARFYDFYLYMGLFTLLGFGLIGFADDLLKLRGRSSKGLRGKYKFTLQSLAALLISALLYFHDESLGVIVIPFVKDYYLNIGPYFILFASFIIVGSSNAVNLTDGLDGLAIGVFAIAITGYLIFLYAASNYGFTSYLSIPYMQNIGGVIILCAALLGSSIGFLWFNSYPASIFMGDIGSISLGAILGYVAIISKQEILLVIIGFVFVIEALSVIFQVGSYKLRKKRIFRMAPIHHHFEMEGVPEPKIVIRLWIISLILTVFALSTLKLRIF